MDPGRGKPQHSYKGYKSAFPYNCHHENNNYNMPSNHGMFRAAKIQRHILKWRKDHFSRGSYRFPYRKNDLNTRKPNKSAEDVEEEERKKKLTDTANKLLSKIKTWNAENNQSEEESQQNEVTSENNYKHNEEKVNSESKPKRIAHSRKARLMKKNRTPKSFSQPAKTVTRYDVNKETVKDFQNRIQHKLIEEIMQMPKENLQNVLNDPKINPIMEVKMSRLVRENKLLIAQKLRALAESKMKSPGSSTNPQLLVDIDKLIDPVIETDLSVLPFELIKQMENVFQVQFDYSPNPDSHVESSVCDSVVDSVNALENEIPMEMSSETEQNVKVENNEDLSLYECSTDEDEIYSSRSIGSDPECNCATLEDILSEVQEAVESVNTSEVNTNWKNKKRKDSTDFEPAEGSDLVSTNREEKSPTKVHKNVPETEIHAASCNPIPVESILGEPVQSSSSHVKVSTSTNSKTENATTQTPAASSAVENLYGVPLPKEATDESVSSLLEEVNSIQILTNKLNERRFMIFLQLAKMNPTGSFISDETSKKNFLETLSNGSLHLVESLRQFFTNPQSHRNWNQKKRKPPERNKNRSKYREHKNNS